MTDKPAALFASYTDAKFMRGLKMLRVTLELPIEKGPEFFAMFGYPDATDPVPVAIARLNPQAPVAEPSSGVSRAEPEGKKVYTRSQIAALKIRDAHFQYWLGVSGDVEPGEREIEADAILKDTLSIQSKRELDTDPKKAEAWDKLLTSYDFKDRVK